MVLAVDLPKDRIEQLVDQARTVGSLVGVLTLAIQEDRRQAGADPLEEDLAMLGQHAALHGVQRLGVEVRNVVAMDETHGLAFTQVLKARLQASGGLVIVATAATAPRGDPPLESAEQAIAHAIDAWSASTAARG